MATPTYIAPIKGLRGKLNKKDKTVFRQKHARDVDGSIIADMKPEAFVVQHPRDWKKKPAKGAEKAKQECWAEACARTKAILDDPAQRALWQERWRAQLKKGDKDSPLDPRTNKPKIYIKFDCYVRAKVWMEVLFDRRPWQKVVRLQPHGVDNRRADEENIKREGEINRY